MIGWTHPAFLYWIPLLPAMTLAAVLLWAVRRRRAAESLGDAPLVARLAGADLARFPWRRTLLVVPAAALLGVAVAGPTWGRETGGRGARVDAVLVLDASHSMRVDDVAPDRLEVARGMARTLLRELRGARIGMVVFAGRAYIVSPRTVDRGAMEVYLDALSPDALPQGGTSLADALLQGARLAGDGPGGALVLLSDGDALDPAGEVMAAARQVARGGVTIHAVGIGTTAGGPVPDVHPETGRRRGFKREPDGRIARSSLGRALLEEVADAGGGSYREGTVAGLAAELADRAARGPARGLETAGDPANRYAWLAGGALLLLLLDSLLEAGARRARTRTREAG